MEAIQGFESHFGSVAVRAIRIVGTIGGLIAIRIVCRNATKVGEHRQKFVPLAFKHFRIHGHVLYGNNVLEKNTLSKPFR